MGASISKLAFTGILVSVCVVSAETFETSFGVKTVRIDEIQIRRWEDLRDNVEPAVERPFGHFHRWDVIFTPRRVPEGKEPKAITLRIWDHMLQRNKT